MELVPVVDLMGGKVVRALKGDRASYRPLSSPLSPTADPEAVVDAFLGLHPFPAIYIADLDSIQRRGGNGQVVRRLRAAFPSVGFWVDSGLSGEAECRAWLAQNRAHLVLGSESQTDLGTLNALSTRADADRLLLSLDFRGAEFLGPSQLLDRPTSWPTRTICMTLERVGAGGGVDLQRLLDLKRRAPNHRLYAAGGVRGEDDLDRLAAVGAAGVLLASALHDGAIGRVAIERHHRPVA